MTKLAGKLPDDHGLDRINQSVCADPTRKYVVVGVLEADSIRTDTDSMLSTATMRIRRVEVVRGEDLRRADQLLRRAIERRTGQEELPLELEDEISELLADVVNLETGELYDETETGSEERAETEQEAREWSNPFRLVTDVDPPGHEPGDGTAAPEDTEESEGQQ